MVAVGVEDRDADAVLHVVAGIAEGVELDRDRFGPGVLEASYLVAADLDLVVLEKPRGRAVLVANYPDSARIDVEVEKDREGTRVVLTLETERRSLLGWREGSVTGYQRALLTCVRELLEAAFHDPGLSGGLEDQDSPRARLPWRLVKPLRVSEVVCLLAGCFLWLGVVFTDSAAGASGV